MSKKVRTNKISKAGKANNMNDGPDEKKTKLEDVQPIVETPENFKLHDFIKLNVENVTKHLVKKAFKKLKNIVKEGKHHLLYISSY